MNKSTIPQNRVDKNLTLKQFLEIFHDIEKTKDKIFKVDPDLERYVEDATLHCKLYNNEANTV